MANNGFKINFLVSTLNRYADAYYNGIPLCSDQKYDEMLKELEQLEKETGIVLSSSPVNKVGYSVRENVAKVTHTSPMLSLAKVHTYEEVIDFMQEQPCIASFKEDGMTCRLTYNSNGELIAAESRGDGHVGQDILPIVRESLLNVPLKIGHRNKLVVDGEIICKYDDFEIANANGEYTIPRALVSGSMSLLDTKEARKKRMSFIAWRVISGLSDDNSMIQDFIALEELGFEVVQWIDITEKNTEDAITALIDLADLKRHPIDGIVISYDNKHYTEERTEHHFKHSVAYKPETEKKETTLRGFEWSIGRSSVLTPVALFDTVILDNTEVSRASCHNVTYIKNLELGVGDSIIVHKSNQIIPEICENLTKSNKIELPTHCPYCDTELLLNKENETEVLICPNNNCCGKTIEKFANFVSKKGMSIEGLSNAILDVLLRNHFITKYADLYSLKNYEEELKNLDRFGEKSVENLLNAIEKSKQVKLSNFLVALGIPLVGTGVAKIIAKECKEDFTLFKISCESNFDWSKIDTIGKKISDSINSFWSDNSEEIIELSNIITFEESKPVEIQESEVTGKKFCITGSFSQNRDILKQKLEALGAIFVSGVSKKTDILFAGEKAGSKLTKAEQLGIKVMNEEELMKIIGENNA